MVSHKYYNLDACEDFVILLTSNSITCFIDNYTLGMKSLINLLGGSEHTYIAFWTLKVKSTQYGLCGQEAFKNAKAILFFKSSRASNNFRLRS
jgi:hypothetical protein